MLCNYWVCGVIMLAVLFSAEYLPLDFGAHMLYKQVKCSLSRVNAWRKFVFLIYLTVNLSKSIFSYVACSILFTKEIKSSLAKHCAIIDVVLLQMNSWQIFCKSQTRIFQQFVYVPPDKTGSFVGSLRRFSKLQGVKEWGNILCTYIANYITDSISNSNSSALTHQPLCNSHMG